MESLTTDALHIDIASTRFAVTCPDYQVLAPNWPPYANFIESQESIVSKIDVCVDLFREPDIQGMSLLFNQGDEWRVLRDRTTHCMIGKRNSETGGFSWFAAWRGSMTSVVVYSRTRSTIAANGKKTITTPVAAPHDLRLLVYHLASRAGVLLHSAAVSLSGHGLVFLGRSGVGKSTISQQFLARQQHDPLSDEHVVARKLAGGYRIFGTPWASQAAVAENRNAPLSALFFLAHGEKNQVREVSAHEALSRIYPVASIPWYDDEILDPILSTCAEIASSVPAFELQFQPTQEVVDFMTDFVSRQL
jgi:hypothetical protein